MKHLYALFAACAFAFFAWAQYNAHGLLDDTASRQTERGATGSRGIFHK